MDDKILEAFRFGRIQECVNIKLKLDEHGIKWEDFVAWVADKASRTTVFERPRIPNLPNSVLKRRCPECDDAWLSLTEVNHAPGFMLEDESLKCVWQCLLCEWEEFSETNIVDEARPYVEEISPYL